MRRFFAVLAAIGILSVGVPLKEAIAQSCNAEDACTAAPGWVCFTYGGEPNGTGIITWIDFKYADM